MPTKSKTDILRQSPVLLPEPRHIELTGDMLALAADRLIVIKAPIPAALLFEAQEAQRALSENAGLTWHINAIDTVPADTIGLVISTGSGTPPTEALSHPQGYTLDIAGDSITIHAADTPGAFYAVMTLTQLLRQYGDR